MATITSTQSGNFSSTSTWVGGVVPTSADTAVAATGHVVAIDVDVTVTKVTQAGTGKFTLGNGRTLTAAVEANAGTFTSGGTVEVTATTTAIITGAVTAVSSTTSNIAGVVITGSGSLTINGNVTGSASNNSSEALGSSAVYTNVACTITINGLITPGSGAYKRGVHLDASASGSLYANNGTSTVALGGTTGSYGIWIASNTGSVYITGNLVGNASGAALYTSGSSVTAVVNGNATSGQSNSSYAIAFNGGSLSITGNITSATAGQPNLIAVYLVSGVITCNITGNVTGGNGSGGTASAGLYIASSTATVTVTGTVTAGNSGGLGPAIYSSATGGSLTITGNVNGSSSAGSHGIQCVGNSASRTTTVYGTVTAGAWDMSHGIYDTNTNIGYLVVAGSLIDSASGNSAVNARRFRCISTLNTTRQHANNTGYPSGGMITYGSLDYIPNNIPVPADVRSGVVYGNNTFTGTCAVPAASSVGYGVPVGNTTGTAALSPADVAALVGAQITATLTSTP